MAYPKALHTEARKLRERGWTYEAIADSLGVSRTTVAVWLDPERREALRQAQRRWRRANPTGYCTRHKRPRFGENGDCRECRRERGQVRMALASRWWTKGVPSKEIAKRLGIPLHSLYQLVQAGRKLGFPFPYRKRLTESKYEDQIHITEVGQG